MREHPKHRLVVNDDGPRLPRASLIPVSVADIREQVLARLIAGTSDPYTDVDEVAIYFDDFGLPVIRP